MESQKYYNYRVVKSNDTLTVCIVTYDQNQQPLSYEPVDLTAENAQDLSTILIYCTGALTEPVIDVTMFNKSAQSTNDALNLLRSK